MLLESKIGGWIQMHRATDKAVDGVYLTLVIIAVAFVGLLIFQIFNI
nr:MAG TPA: hypothetical protein [Caudoviricetes sp.]